MVQVSSPDGAVCTRCSQAVRCSVKQVSRRRRCRCRLQMVQEALGVSKQSGAPVGRCSRHRRCRCRLQMVQGAPGVSSQSGVPLGSILSRWCRVHQVSPALGVPLGRGHVPSHRRCRGRLQGYIQCKVHQVLSSQRFNGYSSDFCLTFPNPW